MYHTYSYGPMYNPWVCTIYRPTPAPQQRVFLCASSATLDRQFRYSNHPIRCSTATRSIHTASITNTIPRGCCIYQNKNIYQRNKKKYLPLRLKLLIPRAKCKVAVNSKMISRQSLREDVRMLVFAGNMRDLDHTLLGQIPRKRGASRRCVYSWWSQADYLQAQSLLRCPQGRRSYEPSY